MQQFHKFITWRLCVAEHVSGEEAPETCWATHKRQVINLWNCCILLVNLFESFFYEYLESINSMCFLDSVSYNKMIKWLEKY